MKATRRDKCYLAGVRALRLTPEKSAFAWGYLAMKLEEIGELDLPKFKHLLGAIRAATIAATTPRSTAEIAKAEAAEQAENPTLATGEPWNHPDFGKGNSEPG